MQQWVTHTANQSQKSNQTKPKKLANDTLLQQKYVQQWFDELVDVVGQQGSFVQQQ
jgi:hypothetical protein